MYSLNLIGFDTSSSVRASRHPHDSFYLPRAIPQWNFKNYYYCRAYVVYDIVREKHTTTYYPIVLPDSLVAGYCFLKLTWQSGGKITMLHRTPILPSFAHFAWSSSATAGIGVRWWVHDEWTITLTQRALAGLIDDCGVSHESHDTIGLISGSGENFDLTLRVS